MTENDTKTANAALVVVRNGQAAAMACAWNDPGNYPLDGRGIKSRGFRCDGLPPGTAMRAVLAEAAAWAKSEGKQILTAWCHGPEGMPDISGNYDIAGIGAMAICTAAPDGPDAEPNDPKHIRYRTALEKALSLLDTDIQKPEEPFIPKPGEHVLYVNGPSLEIGRVKSVNPGRRSAYVWYSEGDTAALTPLECLRPLINKCMIQSRIGGRDAASLASQAGAGQNKT